MEPTVETALAPVHAPVVARREPATVGSLFVAMLVGALIAVSALYAWGAQVAKEQRLASPTAVPE